MTSLAALQKTAAIPVAPFIVLFSRHSFAPAKKKIPISISAAADIVTCVVTGAEKKRATIPPAMEKKLMTNSDIVTLFPYFSGAGLPAVFKESPEIIKAAQTAAVIIPKARLSDSYFL